MTNQLSSRRAIALKEDFFCDGAFFVITSTSLGGSNLSPEKVSQMLGHGVTVEITELLNRGICLPLFFPGDCAMNGAIFIIGELTEQEQNEWIGRIAWRLNIPCGKLVFLCGGGDEDEFAIAVSEQEHDEDYDEIFNVIPVPPGEYLVEVFAYASSVTANFYFDADDYKELSRQWRTWFQQTRPGIKLPEWLDDEHDKYVSYLVRLSPLQELPPLPKLNSETNWCGEFEFRKLEQCPLGIKRKTVLSSPNRKSGKN